MGTDISGWVEVRYADVYNEPELANWFGVIDIGFFIQGRNYKMFALLFGVRYRDAFFPVAPHRGVPNDASSHVNNEVGQGEWHDASWASWREISACDWGQIVGNDECGGEWRLVLNNMEWLANKFGDENVRLVAYFDS